MKRKPVDWVNKTLKLIIVALVILLLLLMLRDLSLHKVAFAKNLDRTNQSIHNLQVEFETLRVTNVNLIKHIGMQQARITELEALQVNTVEQLTSVEQPVIHNIPVNAPQTTPEKKQVTYLDYVPFEIITVVVGTLELARQIIFPRYSLN